MNPEHKINEAIDLAEQGQTEQAIKILQTIQHPQDAYAKAQLNLGLIFYQQGKVEEAEQAYKNVKYEDSTENYTKAQFNLGSIFDEQGKLEKAEQAYKNVKYEDFPKAYANAQLHLGVIFDTQGKLPEAEQAYKSVKCEDFPEAYAKAQFNLGLLYQEHSNLEEAEKAWKNVTHKDSSESYAEAQFNLGVLFDKQGKPEEAEQAYKNVQRKDLPKTYANAQFNLGLLFDKQGKLEEAKKAWENIQQADFPETYIEAQFNLGVLFDKQGKPEETEQTWKNIKREDSPKVYAKAQFNLGLHYQEQDEPEKAQKAWENIKYKHSPKAYAKAQFNLGALFHKQGKLPEAEQTWKNIKREDSPENYTKAQFLLGYSSFKEEQFAKAKEYFQHINFYSIPQDDWMHTTQKFFTIAIIKLIKEDINIAKEFLNHIVLPEYFFARNALQNIVNLEKSRDLLAVFQSVHNILKDLALGQEIHEYEHQFAHYTRPSTAHLLLSGKSPFRLNTIANVNDPTEGEILNHYLNHTLPENSKQAVFISCFTFNHDSLNQFRLYGKEDGQEASGCSMVLDKGFFHSNTMAIGAAMGASNYLMNNSKDEDIKSKEIDNTKEKEQDKPQDKVEKVIGLLPLYRCIYIDKQNPQYVRLACRDEVTFYREFPEETNEEISEKWKEYQNIIQTKQEKVMQELNNIKKSIDELNISQNQDSKLTEALNYILLPLQYLVKHAAFQEEQECRMFYITDWSDEHIQTDFNNHWLYVNYSEKPLKHLRKIYLSPGAMQHQHFFDILVFNENKKKSSQATDTHAKVCHSSNPFRNG